MSKERFLSREQLVSQFMFIFIGGIGRSCDAKDLRENFNLTGPLWISTFPEIQEHERGGTPVESQS